MAAVAAVALRDPRAYTAAVSTELAAIFQQHASHPDAGRRSPAELDHRLRELLDACRTTWPELAVPTDAFIRHLAAHLPGDGDLESALSRMHVPDLYLACGCVAGDPAALSAFDRAILARTPPVLQRMSLSASQIDEILQILRTKLLVAHADQPPALASYAGRGALIGWVRTAARRAALSLHRNKDEQLDGNPDDARALERLPLPADPELDYLKGRYAAELKQAIETAIAALAPEHRHVLRLHYTDELGIDRIGALLGVHRATAARRIQAAAEAVRAETRRLLRERLRLDTAELDSLARLVQSQLHLSLARLLNP